MTSPSRRDFLRAGLAAATVPFLSGCRDNDCDCEPAPNIAATETPTGFRFVHLTDIHVQPELRADEGFRKCLKEIHALNPRPDFILTGGDMVMDVLGADEPRAKSLFDLFIAICKDSDIPFKHCIGNHDVFGWSHKHVIAADHVLYGKKMVQERMNLERTTYSFAHKGWHIAVVDDILPSTSPTKDYEGGFSEADLDWLGKDLAAAGATPKLLCTHVPIVSSMIFKAFVAKEAGVQNVADRSLICRNAGEILKVLKDNAVQLVLAGHLHENETHIYQGTTHIGQGAVCGAWWKGVNNGTPEGFGIIDVKPDGTFVNSYQAYGWKAS